MKGWIRYISSVRSDHYPAGNSRSEGRKEREYLEEEDDVPDESKDDRRVSIGDVGCIDADQLHLERHIKPALTERPESVQSQPSDLETYISLLQEGQHLGDVVESENPMGRLLKAVEL